MRLGKHLEDFQVIKDYHDKEPDIPIQTLCQLLKVSRSGYYKWLNHQETVSEIENKKLMKTIKKALELNPDATPIIHSDRGSQYTSKEYRYITQQAGMTLSMSRVGKCIDNAQIESFFGHFKTESYHLKKYRTYDELVTDVEAYIDFYNTQRYQAKLSNLTPFEFRNQVA